MKNNIMARTLVTSAVLLSMILQTAHGQHESVQFTLQSQNAALAGGQVLWDEQDIRITFPTGWRVVKSGGGEFKADGPDHARLFLIVFDSDQDPIKSLDDEYRRIVKQQSPVPPHAFHYEDIRYLILDGVKGLHSRLVDDSSVDVIWQAFRKSKGKQQFVLFRLTMPVEGFDGRRNELYNILNSTKLSPS